MKRAIALSIGILTILAIVGTLCRDSSVSSHPISLGRFSITDDGISGDGIEINDNGISIGGLVTITDDAINVDIGEMTIFARKPQ